MLSEDWTCRENHTTNLLFFKFSSCILVAYPSMTENGFNIAVKTHKNSWNFFFKSGYQRAIKIGGIILLFGKIHLPAFSAWCIIIQSVTEDGRGITVKASKSGIKDSKNEAKPATVIFDKDTWRILGLFHTYSRVQTAE